MGNRQDISMMRLTDGQGTQLVAACMPEGSGDLLCIQEEDSWAHGCADVTSVLIDCSGLVQITDPMDLDSLAAWLAAASMWLKIARSDGDGGAAIFGLHPDD